MCQNEQLLLISKFIFQPHSLPPAAGLPGLPVEIPNSDHLNLNSPQSKSPKSSPVSPKSAKKTTFSIDSILNKSDGDKEVECSSSDSVISESRDESCSGRSRDRDQSDIPTQTNSPNNKLGTTLPTTLLPNPVAVSTPGTAQPNPLLYSNPLLLAESLAMRHRFIQNQLIQRNFESQMRLINGIYPHPLPKLTE